MASEEIRIEDASATLPDRFIQEASPPPTNVIQLVHSPAIICQLIFWSGIGVLVRIGLLQLHTYSMAPVVAIVYPQIVGCVLMGWVDRNKSFFSKRHPNLQVGLATGLCGSITTFSSMTLAAYVEFAGINRNNRIVGDSLLGGLAVIGLNVGMANICIKVGSHLVDLFPCLNLDAYPERMKRKLEYLDTYLIDRLGPWLLAALFSAVLYTVAISVAFAAESSSVLGHSIGFAVVFAPFGTLLRFYLSKFNAVIHGFPLGTFIGNMSRSDCHLYSFLIP